MKVYSPLPPPPPPHSQPDTRSVHAYVNSMCNTAAAKKKQASWHVPVKTWICTWKSKSATRKIQPPWHWMGYKWGTHTHHTYTDIYFVIYIQRNFDFERLIGLIDSDYILWVNKNNKNHRKTFCQLNTIVLVTNGISWSSRSIRQQ